MDGVIQGARDPCTLDPMCISMTRPLLKNIRTGLIDPTTPKSAMTKTAADGTEWQLVVSLFCLLLDPGANGGSFPTSSILLEERSTKAMIHFSRVWIYGMV